jgi:hypothetical protein
VSLTLKYTCTFPYVNEQPVTMKIDSDIPKSVAVGNPTPEFVIDAVVPVSSDRARVIRLAGVRTVEGTADAKALVAAPQGDTDVNLPFDVTRTNVPESGSFHVRATGAAPARTFTRPGRAKITIGDLTLHLALKNGSGTSTGPGEFDAPCTLDAGQNTVVASFDITGAKTPSGSGTSGATGTGASGTTPGSRTSGSPGSTTDGTTRSTTSGPSGTTASSPSGDRRPDPTKSPSDGAREGATTDGSTGLSAGTATTSGPDTGDLILLAVGTLVVGTLAVAAVVRFRSRGR